MTIAQLLSMRQRNDRNGANGHRPGAASVADTASYPDLA